MKVLNSNLSCCTKNTIYFSNTYETFLNLKKIKNYIKSNDQVNELSSKAYLQGKKVYSKELPYSLTEEFFYYKGDLFCFIVRKRMNDKYILLFDCHIIANENESEEIDMTKIETKSHELQLWADSMREKHLDRISKGSYLPVTALTYSDMVVALRKIRAHSLLMAGAISNLNQKFD